MNAQIQETCYDSHSTETSFRLSLAENFNPVEVDYSANVSLLLEIQEFRDVVGLGSPLQAGFLVNADHSCWITNLGTSGTTEVYRPENKSYRRLRQNQVAYLRHGDYVGFYGAFFKMEFLGKKLVLIPLHILKATKQSA